MNAEPFFSVFAKALGSCFIPELLFNVTHLDQLPLSLSPLPDDAYNFLQSFLSQASSAPTADREDWLRYSPLRIFI